jgi:DNA-directed RNA polymerase specialized sigma24 family protein
VNSYLLGGTGTQRASAAELLQEERVLHGRILQRDESALLEFLDRVGHVLFCAALVHTGDATAAEDLTEELFVDLWEAPEAFSPARGPVALQLLERMARGWSGREAALASVAGSSPRPA